MIAAAANLQFAMGEIVQSFEEKTGQVCDLVIGASGQLTTQLMEGAPYDVFLSADVKYPKTLYEAGLTIQAPSTYAYGQLVMWSLESIPGSIRQLDPYQIRHIAIANPLNAPYGAAAVEALKYFDVYEALEEKLVFGENISQTNHFILSRAATLGFTAKSVVLSPRMKTEGTWIDVDSAGYRPIAQGAVVMKNSKKLDLAEQFFQFLFSEQAQEIFHQYGYLINRNIE